MNQLILPLFCTSRAPPQRLECPPTRQEIALRESRSFLRFRAPPNRLECPPTRPEIALREFRRFCVQRAAALQPPRSRPAAAAPQPPQTPRSRPAAIPQPPRSRPAAPLPQPPRSRPAAVPQPHCPSHPTRPAAAPQPCRSSTATNSHRGARPQDVYSVGGHHTQSRQLARCHNSLDSFDCSQSRRQAPDSAGRLRTCNWEIQIQ